MPTSFKRARRELKFLRTRLGRIIRDIRHKIEGNTALEDRFGPLLDLAGTGGEELFGGYYTSYRHLPVLQRWCQRAAWVPRGLHEQVGVEMNRVATRWSGNSQGGARCGHGPRHRFRSLLRSVRFIDASSGARSRVTGTPEMGPLGVDPGRSGPLAQAQAGVLIGAEETPEL